MSCQSVSLPYLLPANDTFSQDTNVTQYELMKALAVDRCVTVVGDPDQSSMVPLFEPFFLQLISFVSNLSLRLALCGSRKSGKDASWCVSGV
jgi:hypothetical protein